MSKRDGIDWTMIYKCGGRVTKANEIETTSSGFFGWCCSHPIISAVFVAMLVCLALLVWVNRVELVTKHHDKCVQAFVYRGQHGYKGVDFNG